MNARDGFGLHVDLARRDLARSAFLAPSGIEDLQSRFCLPEAVGCGTLELTALSSGISYCRWNCDNARDVDQLDHARHILCARYHDPPTISELANEVGLNRTKLKAGFKRQFGSTIYAFIRSRRMQHAIILMREGECNVSEAAAIVGYNSPSAFAAAFRAEFGVLPHSVLGCEDAEEHTDCSPTPHPV